MKTMLVAVVLGLAACGGSSADQLFKGDPVVAELRSGVPFCSQGQTGPTLHTSETVAIFRETTTDPGITYTSTIVSCDWTCGNINGTERAFVHVVFYTNQTGAWVIDPHADSVGASCP